MTCGIVAASALGAGGRTSCKRQVIDSDPDGSQQARLAFFVVAQRDKRDIVISSNNYRSPNRRSRTVKSKRLVRRPYQPFRCTAHASALKWSD